MTGMGFAQPAARTWWGWGATTEQLTPTETAALVARTQAMLPDHDFPDHGPPDPTALGIASAQIRPPATLAALCSDNPVDRISHARGKAFRDVVRNLLGQIEHIPDLVARPRRERDVVDLLDWCSATATPVIPYGGGRSGGGREVATFAHPG